MGTRGQWAKDLAGLLGNSNPSQDILKWIAAWEAAEGGGMTGTAAFNPLNTCQDMPGATAFNAPLACVKNYQNRADGLAATAKTLSYDEPGYAAIVAGIVGNDSGKAQYGLSIAPWGTSSGLVQSIYATSDRTSDDLTGEAGVTIVPAAPSSPDSGWSGGGASIPPAPSTPDVTILGQSIHGTGSIIDGLNAFFAFFGKVGQSIVAEFSTSAWLWHGAALVAILVGSVIILREFIPVQSVVQAAKAVAA